MEKYKIGIITSHISEGFLSERTTVSVPTPWGSADVYCGKAGGINTAVILRYGEETATASHRINYRANIWALHLLGTEIIISQNAIGSVNEVIQPGDFVIPNDFIDFTKARALSFFQDEECWVRVDMTQPFCEIVRNKIIRASEAIGIKPHKSGVFICTEGPRFETPAEIKFFRSIGGDIIGTPLVPEIVLAHEVGMCFASISIVINMATGMAPSVKHSGDDGIITFYRRTGMEEKVEKILGLVINELNGERQCNCKSAFDDSVHGRVPEWMKDNL